MLEFSIGVFLLGFIYLVLSMTMAEFYRDMGYFKKIPWLAGFLTIPIIMIIGWSILLALTSTWNIIIRGGILNV